MKILVTGGDGGLGSWIAHELVNKYNHKVRTLGRSRCHIKADLSHYPVTWLSEIEGNFDAVVHCAGAHHLSTINELDYYKIEELIRVNALSNLAINKLLIERGLKVSCHVIGEVKPSKFGLAYDISKSAQLMVMQSLALEYDIITFGVSPGKFAGSRMSDYIDNTLPELHETTFEQTREYELATLRTGEMDVPTVAEFICTMINQATPYMNGHNYSIGG